MTNRLKEDKKSGAAALRPENAARASIASLKACADPKRAEGQRRYFKEQVEFLGLTTPKMREIEAEVWQKVQGTWGFPEAVAFAETMLKERFYEIRALGLLILLRFRKEFPASFPERVRGWLRADRLDNWALVDVFCPDALGPILEKDPKFVTEIKTWTADSNRWVKRASVVSFIKIARRGTHLDAGQVNVTQRPARRRRTMRCSSSPEEHAATPVLAASSRRPAGDPGLPTD